MITKIISGGQTGADQGALRAAKAAGIQTGGWVPRHCMTEVGPMRSLLTDFGCQEANSESYAFRTRLNVRDSDGTLWVSNQITVTSPGYYATAAAANDYERPFKIVKLILGTTDSIEDVLSWCQAHEIRILNVAGHRESSALGLGAQVEFLIGRLLAACTTST
jgi:hypothetical protein